MFAQRGVQVVDTDAIARQLTGPGGEAMPALRTAFGETVMTADGSLDRARMRQLAFSNPAVRERLQALLHPLITVQAEARAATAAAAGRAVLFDVPLLVESGNWRGRVDKVLVLDCSEATQVTRVAARPGWDEAMARSVIAQQATREQRLAVADAVILNEGLALQDLQDEVAALGASWGLWNNPTTG
jgi:dephospho-CoA kinase